MPYFVDLHCHTSASFDCLASPESQVRAAAKRGLTHLAITDHDRIDGALRARDAAPAGLTVIVGEEIKTADGDLVAVFLERVVAPGRPARETIEEVRAQGGLVGIPHPFDKYRGSMLNDPRLEAIGGMVDWVEAHNARVVAGSGNQRAAAFARELGLPGVAVSDAHSTVEVGVAYTVVDGRPVHPGRTAGGPDQRRVCRGPGLVYRANPHPDLQAREPRPGQPARAAHARGERAAA